MVLLVVVGGDGDSGEGVVVILVMVVATIVVVVNQIKAIISLTTCIYFETRCVETTQQNSNTKKQIQKDTKIHTDNTPEHTNTEHLQVISEQRARTSVGRTLGIRSLCFAPLHEGGVQ